MSAGTAGGAFALALLIGLLGRSLFAMRPLWPYILIAVALFAGDTALRGLPPSRSVEIAGVQVLEPARNDARVEAGVDLGWPNRLAAFTVSALAVWLLARPQRRSPLVGTGLALVVPSGVLNLAEPLLRGFTTDYLVAGPLTMNVADVGILLGVPLACVGVVIAEIATATRARKPAPVPAS